MSLLKAHKDSNAAQSSDNTGAATGSLGMVGFTSMDYPGQRPAMKNTDVGTTKDSIGALGNDGTNMSAYSEQPKTENAENPK